MTQTAIIMQLASLCAAVFLTSCLVINIIVIFHARTTLTTVRQLCPWHSCHIWYIHTFMFARWRY